MSDSLNANFDFDDEPPRRAAPQPVTTLIELQALDEADMLKGYFDGLKNKLSLQDAPDAPSNTPRDWRAYNHGFLNGLVDGGHAQASPAQQLLAREYLESGMAKRDAQRRRGVPA